MDAIVLPNKIPSLSAEAWNFIVQPSVSIKWADFTTDLKGEKKKAWSIQEIEGMFWWLYHMSGETVEDKDRKQIMGVVMVYSEIYAKHSYIIHSRQCRPIERFSTGEQHF